MSPLVKKANILTRSSRKKSSPKLSMNTRTSITSVTPTELADLRRDYRQASLNEGDVYANPMTQFATWMAQARAAGVPEPNAMNIATVRGGKPSARTVLLKGLDTGFCFYTNFESRKGQDIALNPNAALTFLWHELERQIRIEGVIEKVEDTIADAYYASRPVSSQIGAWASPQSQVISSRKVLEDNEAQITQKFLGTQPPRPPHWGGYRVIPNLIEFWQGRSSRLHDRLCYRRHTSQSNWTIERLAP
jgi:pyridoxamine 5'-phosphate oxidase